MLFSKSVESVNQKNRNKIKYKKNRLVYGNIGFFFCKYFRFEFFNFLFFKSFLKLIFLSKYISFEKKRYWFYVNANLPCRKKSKNSRMGKGIGSFFSWSNSIPMNFIFFEILFFHNFKVFQFCKMCKLKISQFLFLKIL